MRQFEQSSRITRNMRQFANQWQDRQKNWRQFVNLPVKISFANDHHVTLFSCFNVEEWRFSRNNRQDSDKFPGDSRVEVVLPCKRKNNRVPRWDFARFEKVVNYRFVDCPFYSTWVMTRWKVEINRWISKKSPRLFVAINGTKIKAYYLIFLGQRVRQQILGKLVNKRNQLM